MWFNLVASTYLHCLEFRPMTIPHCNDWENWILFQKTSGYNSWSTLNWGRRVQTGGLLAVAATTSDQVSPRHLRSILIALSTYSSHLVPASGTTSLSSSHPERRPGSTRLTPPLPSTQLGTSCGIFSANPLLPLPPVGPPHHSQRPLQVF